MTLRTQDLIEALDIPPGDAMAAGAPEDLAAGARLYWAANLPRLVRWARLVAPVDAQARALLRGLLAELSGAIVPPGAPSGAAGLIGAHPEEPQPLPRGTLAPVDA